MTHESALAKSETILKYNKTLIRLYHELVKGPLESRKIRKKLFCFFYIFLKIHEDVRYETLHILWFIGSTKMLNGSNHKSGVHKSAKEIIKCEIKL